MKKRAPRNQTLTCVPEELRELQESLVQVHEPIALTAFQNKIINGKCEAVLPHLPAAFVDLLIVDPPYNLTKNYNGNMFTKKKDQEYIAWFSNIFQKMLPLLKPNATIYVCADWATSNLIFPILNQHVVVRNRITWEREKGRGAKANWKNNTEDIWFATASDDYVFNVEAVKLRRKVMAPYKKDGKPKDWEKSDKGNFRMTHPSNIWSDITIPFWSMRENTDHKTQKPEKAIAKLILASSNEGGFVFDPFLGSGTTAVVAQKLGRQFSGIEMNTEYCCWGVKRLKRAQAEPHIQGYVDGVFWERSSAPSHGS